MDESRPRKKRRFLAATLFSVAIGTFAGVMFPSLSARAILASIAAGAAILACLLSPTEEESDTIDARWGC